MPFKIKLCNLKISYVKLTVVIFKVISLLSSFWVPTDRLLNNFPIDPMADIIVPKKPSQETNKVLITNITKITVFIFFFDIFWNLETISQTTVKTAVAAVTKIFTRLIFLLGRQ